MPNKPGRPQGSLNKPKNKAVDVPSSLDILTKNEYKHLRDPVGHYLVNPQLEESEPNVLESLHPEAKKRRTAVARRGKSVNLQISFWKER